nr:hypothetical protein [Tanacetum cinerariifolium]
GVGCVCFGDGTRFFEPKGGWVGGIKEKSGVVPSTKAVKDMVVVSSYVVKEPVDNTVNTEDLNVALTRNQRVTYLVVANYVKNTWGKYGLVKSMLNSSTRIFSFQFSSTDGLDAMLENNPWFIRNNSLILKKWNLDVNLLKKDVGNVPVWFKLHGVPVFAHTQEECPKNPGLGVAKILKKPSQALKGVPGVGYQRGTSNLASNGANSSGSSFWNVETSSTSTTPIVDKIGKIEKLIMDEKITLVDDDDIPLKKVDYPGDHDSEDEVESVDNDMARFMASEKVGFGTKSLLEQWMNSYENGDYDEDPYDDGMYEGQDIPDKIQDMCDNLDIRV